LDGPNAAAPTNTTAPTWQCVVLTGISITLASTTVRVLANSMQNPRW
jgi:multisubunit Na+/H+ antiporter MnhC subunit